MTTYTDDLTGFTSDLDDATQYATIYRGDRPVGTLQRKRVYEDGPAWKLFAAPNGELVTAKYLAPHNYHRLMLWASAHLHLWHRANS